MKLLVVLVLALSLASSPSGSVWAQTESPAAEEGQTVSGRAVNITTGDPGPEGLEVMLHGWEAEGTQLEMKHGVSEQGGVFTFGEVQLQPNVLYAVMAIYKDVTYFSKPTEVREDGTLEPIEVEVYEVTSSDLDVSLEQLHILLGWAQGGLSVAEVYAVSNAGNRTVKDARLLKADQSATLLFSLPEGAANLSFPTGPADRYVRQDAGFADTKPLIPGIATAQVVAMYILPYEDALVLRHGLAYDLRSVTVFVPHALGLTLDESTAEYLGVETFADGQSYEGYALGSYSSGDEIELSISGRVPAQAGGTSSDSLAIRRSGSGEGIAYGAAALGLSMITAGIWWLRRQRSAWEESDEGGFSSVQYEASDWDGGELPLDAP